MLIDDFKTRFPEFGESVVDTRLPNLESVWPCYYGGKYKGCEKEIVLNLLAHLLVVETRSKNATMRKVQSKSAGRASVSYAARSVDSTEEFFSTTKYGQRFWLLTGQNAGGFFV